MFLRISVLLFSFLCFQTSLAQNAAVRVNKDRLENHILTLATYGQDDQGVTNRVAYSDADLAGRAYVIDLMKNAGLTVHIDFAGNIIGKRAGKDASKKPIAFGSHIDMVPNGGNYDGCVGSMGAIEVIESLNDANITTIHPLEVIIFSDEEGGVFGSRAMAGAINDTALEVQNSTGYSVREGVSRIGGDPDKISQVARTKDELAAFLELHIEQGGTLYNEGVDIGVVEGIVGIKWWNVTFNGFANHAGTTPMDMRQDALLAASKFVIAVNEVVLGYEGKHVGTVGRIMAKPGAPNVIPGEVILSLEIRDLSSEKISQLFKDIKVRGEQIAKEGKVQVSFSPIDATAKPALTAPSIQKAIEATAKELDFSYKYMPSGAGHDAQDMALITPTGMIFVPSKGGISHSPKEFTSAVDMANGTNVLLHTILKLDGELN